MKRKSVFLKSVSAASVAAMLAFPAVSKGIQITGPSSSDTPYLVPTAGSPIVDVVSILTAGDTVGNVFMVGIPDGLGAYDNGNGTMTLIANHEISSTNDGPLHGYSGGLEGGAFVSRWVVSTTPGPDFLKVLSGQDLDQAVVTNTTGAGTLKAFSRFCSGDLAPVTAFFNSNTGKGIAARIYMNGEESGSNGRAMAHVIDSVIPNTGVGYQLNAFDHLGAWENLLANPFESDTTIVMGNSDGARNSVYMYVGTKQSTGSDIEKAGLVGGTTYAVQAKFGGVDVASESRDFGLGSGSSAFAGTFSLTAITRDADGNVTGGDTGTGFLRPEDGAWDNAHPEDYYFVTTDRYDATKDGVGAQVGQSRLWRMRFDDITDPTAGGHIEALLDGSEAQQMMDNICVVDGIDGHTRIMALEDVGGNAHNGKVWLYDTVTDELTLIAMHDTARNGDLAIAATAPFNQDEEFSGIIDARDTLGLGWFLLVDQQHFDVDTAQYEGGQILAFYAPGALGVIPEPSSIAVLALPLAMTTFRRRRAR